MLFQKSMFLLLDVVFLFKKIRTLNKNIEVRPSFFKISRWGAAAPALPLGIGLIELSKNLLRTFEEPSKNLRRKILLWPSGALASAPPGRVFFKVPGSKKKKNSVKVIFLMFFTSGITSRSSRMAILTPWIDIKTQKKILNFRFFFICLVFCL